MLKFKQVENIDCVCEETYKDLVITEAEYQGKTVKLNDPIRGGSKKFYVYVKDGDRIKKVSFGDTTGLSIKRDDPARRKSSVQDITVIRLRIKQVQDTGRVINGVLMHQSITNVASLVLLINFNTSLYNLFFQQVG